MVHSWNHHAAVGASLERDGDGRKLAMKILAILPGPKLELIRQSLCGAKPSTPICFLCARCPVLLAECESEHPAALNLTISKAFESWWRRCEGTTSSQPTADEMVVLDKFIVKLDNFELGTAGHDHACN